MDCPYCDGTGKKQELLFGGEEMPKVSLKTTAVRILEFMNSKRIGKRGYRPTDVNLGFIKARLKEGYTEQECKTVIAIKWRKWKNTDMEPYFRPATLFNREKFNQYAGEIGEGGE